jgi:hypothetical protein
MLDVLAYSLVDPTLAITTSVSGVLGILTHLAVVFPHNKPPWLA